ncbi:ABC transporter permease [Nesterenkonia sp. MY13]|uniref:ABC transporter permease n=1 Tax=Nesterenkonia sedimenti TaxID=1463632 RepID=A0A7X8YD01_9MICC|nr:ABC transporter permease [Nesterenkonia sedimenti]NLS08950.1 ABC transporter permease [Nesterenkonia sedimenti]
MTKNRPKIKKSRLFLYLLCVPIAFWLVAPTLVVIPLSFTPQRSFAFPPPGFSLEWYENFFTSPQWLGGLLNSLQIALLVASISSILGTLAAYGLSKTSGFRKTLSNGLLVSPILIPAVIFGVGVYAVFLRTGLVGTMAGFVLAHTMLALPFVVVNVGAVLVAYDTQLERAAWVSGAGRIRAFMTVTLPVIWPGVASGFLFAFITSFDEVIVSAFISSPALQTLPVRMFTSVQREVDPTIAAAATLIIILTTAIALTAIFTRKKRKV